MNEINFDELSFEDIKSVLYCDDYTGILTIVKGGVISPSNHDKLISFIEKKEKEMAGLIITLIGNGGDVLLGNNILKIHSKIIECEVLSYGAYTARESLNELKETKQANKKKKPERSVKTDEGYIYALYQDDIVKIGKTTNFENRKNTHITSNPKAKVLLVSDKVMFKSIIEAGLHRFFSENRYSTEWFSIDKDRAKKEILGFISTIDDRVEKCIRNGIRRRLPYKEIYRFAKEEVISLVESLNFAPQKEELA